MGEGPVYLGGWSITSNAVGRDMRDLFEALISDSVFTLSVGDRPIADRHGRDLHTEARPIEEIVPVRQYMRVEAQFYNQPVLDQLNQVSPDHYGQQIVNLWVNLEGWEIHRLGR
jgi:hypothetical protein